MTLDDLLISYNQIIPRNYKPVIPIEPASMYEQMLSNLDLIREKNLNSTPKTQEEQKIPSIHYTFEEPTNISKSQNTASVPVVNNQEKPKSIITGTEEFEKAYDNVEKDNPQAKKYRQFLTKMAKAESGFNKSIQNLAGAPAYGYFQFMQDGKKYNNISHYANTDIETFRNNPELQIKAAIKLAQEFEKGFSQKDLQKAKELGFTKFGLLGGAWLAGVGGVKKYLHQGKNLSDKHWSKENKGTTVSDRIKEFNFRFGGKFKTGHLFND